MKSIQKTFWILIVVGLVRPSAAATNLALGRPSLASTTWATAGFEANKAFDGITTTRWSAASGQLTNQWLRVDLGAGTTYDHVDLEANSFPNRVTSFKLQWSDDGTTFTDIPGTTGGNIGALTTVTFAAVTSRYMRLFMMTATNVPTINEVEVYFDAAPPTPTPTPTPTPPPSNLPAYCASYPQLLSGGDWYSQPVYYDAAGRLAYREYQDTQDPAVVGMSYPALWHRISDFSYAGYRYGEATLPNVPVVLTIGPIAGDDTANIQAAIDAAAAMAPDAFGIRGAVLLNPGTYEIAGTVNVDASGVVLRGSGNGANPAVDTILSATGDVPHQRTVVVLGTDVTNWTESPATRRDITTPLVQVGSTSFDVTSADGYAVGDEITVRHPSTQEWINAVGDDLCDTLGSGSFDTSDVLNRTCLDPPNWWTVGSKDVYYFRRITAISGNTITVDVPLYNHLYGALSTSYIAKVTWNRVKSSGVENLRIDIQTAGGTDENHAWSGVGVRGAEDSWVTRVVALHFGYAGVMTTGAVRITVEDCQALDPVAIVTGGRMYNFSSDHRSQMILFSRCYLRTGRHGFVTNGTGTMSDVVFYRGTAENGDDMEAGHRQWANGILYDNISGIGNSTVRLYNRGDFGTAHGWAAAHSVSWRYNLGSLVQKPYTAQNWGITDTGTFPTTGFPFPGPLGYREKLAGTLKPQSLYEAQMCDRLCDLVAAPAGLTATPNGNNRIDLSWSGAATSYQIHRARTSGGPYTLIGTSGTTSFSDTTVQGGVTYVYVVKAVGLCTSVASLEAAATATGSCGLPPDFAGIVSVTNVAGATCTLRPAWNGGSSACGGAVTYSVYRSTSSTFVPSVSNRIATGLAGTSYTDSAALTPGATYYYVIRATSTINGLDDANIMRGAGTATGCTASAPDPLAILTVRSADNENVVQWVNPVAGYAATRIVYRTDTFPTGPADGTLLGSFAGTPGGVANAPHAGVNGTTYFYGAYADDGAGGFSSGRFAQGQPFNTAGPAKWAYSTGATAMAPPAVSGGSLYAGSNDRVLHAVTRGTVGGLWPAPWTPLLMNAPTQHRAPIVTTTVVPGASRVIFMGSQDGRVYAVNADTGAQLWPSPLLGDVIQAAPVGMFTSFGGIVNHVLVGTRNSATDNRFYALQAATGAVVNWFDNGGGANAIGIVSSSALVDYPGQRVYFASRAKAGGSSNTVWCLRITAGGVTGGCPGWTHRAVGDVDGAITRRNGRLYVGNNAGQVYALDENTGAVLWSFASADGPVKGFVFPDRFSDKVYFTTSTKVWGLRDDGSAAWPPVIVPGPSIVLFTPGSVNVIVGSTDGRLYQLDTTGAAPLGPAPVVKSVLLDGSAVVGTPTLDTSFNQVYVGTDAGIVYDVQLPLP